MRAHFSTRSAAAASLLVAVAVGTAIPARAAFHLARIDEVVTSYGGDATAQLVEIRMLALGQNFTNGTRLAVFDTSGSFVTSFTVTSNVVNAGMGVRWLMATTSMQLASTVAPDFTIPAILPVAGGMVCWGATSAVSQTNPNAHVDCLAYGTYSGPSFTTTGTPTTLDAVGHGLQRTSDLLNNSTAFTCSNSVTPQNNMGAQATLPATAPCPVCGNGTIEGSEACDDGANNGLYGFCKATCSGPGPSCGDSVVNGPEGCDDGNVAGGDCCDAVCQPETPGSACADDGDACTLDRCDAVGVCAHPIEPGNCVDHYLCYKGGQAKGETKLADTTVGLIDPLENRSYVVKKNVGLCNPATKTYQVGPEPPGQPAVHQESYQIKLPTGQAFMPSDHVTQDQFGILHLTLKKPDGLFVRAAKSDLGTTFTSCKTNSECGALSCIGGVCIDPAFPSAPIDGIGRDNYKCYKVAIQKGQPKFAKITGGLVEIDDQFSPSALKYDVLKPTRLCTPVDKAGDNPGAEANLGHLVCYQVKLAKLDPAQPKFVKHKVAVANTNFPDTRLDVKTVSELCVPARRDP